MIARMRLLLLTVVVAGCATNMTDEAAVTMQRTRDATVRTSERLAETADRLPRTFDELNTVLAASGRTAASGLATMTSSTALAIDRLGGLVATLDRAGES